ncbi:hypothetical protein [Halosolutus halophilus]|uniref:hypothetical protein n=1 Tax=Halosolutus halophilus TaxID=1552990 RepID=UPI002234F08C|nr:hypothetical protein [Halosolutus halophilus]
MSLSFRHVLLGHNQSWYWRALWTTLAVVLGVITFVAYVLDVFTVAGGVVFIPGDAALVGIGAAAVVGYVRGGLLVAWLVSFTSLLGFRAYHAFPGLSYRTFPEQLAYFLDPEGLFVYTTEGIALGSIAFIIGSFVRRGSENSSRQ